LGEEKYLQFFKVYDQYHELTTVWTDQVVRFLVSPGVT